MWECPLIRPTEEDRYERDRERRADIVLLYDREYKSFPKKKEKGE